MRAHFSHPPPWASRLNYIMATEKPKQQNQEPKGLGEHNLGRTSEAAQQQGWDLNEEKRTTQPSGKPQHYGGHDFNYGARDFGDTPEDMSERASPASTGKQDAGKRLSDSKTRT